jgi:plastocyanin domain-containing protein
MNLSKLALSAALALAAVPRLAAACDQCDHAHDAALKTTSVAAPAEGKTKAGVRTVELTVTEDGFTPAEIRAKPGETVKLAVTRKVERTCATDIVMKDFGVDEPLPLDKTVTVTVKPKKAGTYRFACRMGHIAGSLRVE